MCVTKIIYAAGLTYGTCHSRMPSGFQFLPRPREKNANATKAKVQNGLNLHKFLIIHRKYVHQMRIQVHQTIFVFCCNFISNNSTYSCSNNTSSTAIDFHIFDSDAAAAAAAHNNEHEFRESINMFACIGSSSRFYPMARVLKH